jgi:hypothetical protein
MRVTSKDMINTGAFASKGAMHKKIGSWTKFAAELGEDIPEKKWKLSKKDLEEEFYRIKKLLGRTPTCTEYTKLGKYNTTTVQRKWGSWTKFLEELGEQKNKTGRKTVVGRRELIAQLKKNIYVMQELVNILERESDGVKQ